MDISWSLLRLVGTRETSFLPWEQGGTQETCLTQVMEKTSTTWAGSGAMREDPCFNSYWMVS